MGRERPSALGDEVGVMYAVGVGCLNEGIETVVHILLYGVVHAALAV